MDFYYSSIAHKDALEITSNMWTSYYNLRISFPWIEEWERDSLEDLILSEKVFDI